MAATFELEIATPDRLLVKQQVAEAEIPGKNGAFGVLPDHAPLISELGIGALTYKTGGELHTLIVSSGWVEVKDNQVRVLAAAAERPNEVDLQRAKKALERAEKRLVELGDWDIQRAIDAAARARVRMELAGKR